MKFLSGPAFASWKEMKRWPTSQRFMRRGEVAENRPKQSYLISAPIRRSLTILDEIDAMATQYAMTRSAPF